MGPPKKRQTCRICLGLLKGADVGKNAHYACKHRIRFARKAVEVAEVKKIRVECEARDDLLNGETETEVFSEDSVESGDSQ